MNHPLTTSRRAAPVTSTPGRDRRLPRALNAITAACLLLAVGWSAGSVHAAPITYTGSVSSPQGVSNVGCFAPLHAGDGTGLTGGGINNGVTLWSTTAGLLHNNGTSCTAGFAFNPGGGVQFTLDLGQVRSVDMLGGWGTDFGVISSVLQNSFKLTADNQQAWGNPLATQLGTFILQGSMGSLASMQTFGAFGPVNARYLHLDFAGAIGAPVGIGELAAREATAVPVPEPGSLALAGLGLVALGGLRRRRLRPNAGRAALVTAAVLAGTVLPAQAGYITWAPGYGYTLSPSGLPTVLGNHAAGGTPTGNPNVVTASTALTPTGSVSLRTYADPNPQYGEVEYELVWTLTNGFFGSTMYTVSFSTQTFGNLLQYDGGLSGAVLDSTPWATQGTLVPGSWTAAGLQFDMGPGGLQSGQSATFHLPLDVMQGSLGSGWSHASNVVAQGGFLPIAPTPVPEPGAPALVGLALAALALVQRRKGR